jgi:AraC-like DNA-binding protein
LHAQACQVVETSLNSLANQEVVRALEQDLIWVLISCLADGKVLEDHVESGQRFDVLPSLESLLAEQPFRLLKTREICSALAVSEATLRAKCSSTLGMSPSHYQRLRRLKLVRAELLQSKSSTKESMEELVLRCGFPNLPRFLAEYWRFYREVPPLRPVYAADG